MIEEASEFGGLKPVRSRRATGGHDHIGSLTLASAAAAEARRVGSSDGSIRRHPGRRAVRPAACDPIRRVVLCHAAS